jgi:hypothetical protein
MEIDRIVDATMPEMSCPTYREVNKRPRKTEDMEGCVFVVAAHTGFTCMALICGSLHFWWGLVNDSYEDNVGIHKRFA